MLQSWGFILINGEPLMVLEGRHVSLRSALNTDPRNTGREGLRPSTAPPVKTGDVPLCKEGTAPWMAAAGCGCQEGQSTPPPPSPWFFRLPPYSTPPSPARTPVSCCHPTSGSLESLVG